MSKRFVLYSDTHGFAQLDWNGLWYVTQNFETAKLMIREEAERFERMFNDENYPIGPVRPNLQKITNFRIRTVQLTLEAD